MAAKAVFLDRDGTLIYQPGTPPDAGRLRALPGAAGAIRRLRAVGYRAIVVTNQPGIARGHFTEDELSGFHACLQQLLVRDGTRLDGLYTCPYLAGDEAVVEKYRVDSDLRKPRPGMLRLAAKEMELDLAGSWMVGSSPHDIEAGKAAGCRTIYVGDLQDAPSAEADYLAKDLASAVDVIEDADRDDAPVAEALIRSGRASEQLLSRILERLDRDRRGEMYHDFSLVTLGAGVSQTLALGLFAWGVAGSLSPGSMDVAFVRLLAAVFMQLVTLSLILSRRHG